MQRKESLVNKLITPLRAPERFMLKILKLTQSSLMSVVCRAEC